MTNVEAQESTTVQNVDDSAIVLKNFNGLNVPIYGTLDDPLFKASEIATVLDIKKIRKTIEGLDDSCKLKKVAPTGGGLQDQWFLTENGLYELLFVSRKPIAKTFRRWVIDVIKEIRVSGKYELENHFRYRVSVQTRYNIKLICNAYLCVNYNYNSK